jgi:hypothetical protein
MSYDKYSKPSVVDHLDNHNTNNNNKGLNLNDFVETEYYAPMDPDGLDQQIIDIFSCNHDNLISTTIPAVNTIMSFWNIYMYRWYCYNCNQQLLSTGRGDIWKCPTCTYLDASKGDNEPHWNFGVCECCENLGPADMTCVTCMINKGSMVTYQALKKALTIYKEEPTLEFAIWANYFHYLEEQCLEVDTWNRLKWMEYYENPPSNPKNQPCKLVTWKCPSQYCSGPEGDLRNVQKICLYCLQVPPTCIKWLVDHNPTKMLSHVFAIRGSPKEEDGNWVKDETCLIEH